MSAAEKSLETEFLKSLENNTLILQVGCRMSGKTTFACCLLRHLMTSPKNPYDEYHLVLPTYGTGQRGGTFDWLDKLSQKQRSKITIYCEFSLCIIDQLIADSDGKKNRFLYLDDATSESQLFSNESNLKALSTKARHYHITSFLCFHFLKRTVSTQLRNSAEWLIIHRATDARLLEGIWEESASLFWNKDHFMSLCRDEMIKDYPSLIIWRDKGKIDCGNGMDWKIQTEHRNKIIHKCISKNDDRHEKDKLKTGLPDTSAKHRGFEPTVQKNPRLQNPVAWGVSRPRRDKKPTRIIARL